MKLVKPWAIFCLLLISLCGYSQIPDMGAPPPVEDRRNGYNEGSGKNEAMDERIDKISDIIDVGTPLLKAFENIDSLKELLQTNGLTGPMFCIKSGNETTMNICMDASPMTIITDPASFKDFGTVVVIAGTPDNEEQVYTITFLKLYRKNKKQSKENNELYAKKAAALLDVIGAGYWDVDDLNSILNSEISAYRDNYNTELVWHDFSANYAKTFNGEVKAWGLVIRSKVNFKGAGTNKLSSSQNKLLDDQLDAYEKYTLLLDSLQGRCYDEEEQENLYDSLFFRYNLPVSPVAQDFSSFENFLAANKLSAKKLTWKKDGTTTVASAGTLNKKPLYIKAFDTYDVGYPAAMIFYTPVSFKKDKPKEADIKNFCKSILPLFDIPYDADSVMLYVNDEIRYYTASGKTFWARFNVRTTDELEQSKEWGPIYENVDTVDKNSVAKPFFSIGIYPEKKLSIDSTVFETYEKAITDSLDKAYDACDSLYRQYVKANKFVWKILPPLVVKETRYLNAQLPLFEQPDTLVARLKKIVGDTTKSLGILQVLFGYNWNMQQPNNPYAVADENESNLYLTATLKTSAYDGQTVRLFITDNSGNPAPDSIYTKYNTYRQQLFELFDITLPKEIDEKAQKEKTAQYITENYSVSLKNNITSGKVKYTLVEISPMYADSISFVAHSEKVTINDTVRHIIPDSVMKAALALSDTLFLDPTPAELEDAGTMVKKLKDNGFNGYWYEDGYKYVYMEDAKTANYYQIDDDSLLNKIVLVIYKEGKSAIGAFLYLYGNPPPKNSALYNKFTTLTNRLYKALKVDMPVKMLMSMDMGTTYEDYMDKNLLGFFTYQYSYDADPEAKLGMMSGIAGKAFLERIKD